MEKLVIGKAVIEYDTTGKIKSATFEPDVKIDLALTFGTQLQELDGPTPEALKESADRVLSAWFSKMNEIELADRDHYEIASEIVSCDKYPNGSVEKCVLEYIFRERPELLN